MLKPSAATEQAFEQAQKALAYFRKAHASPQGPARALGMVSYSGSTVGAPTFFRQNANCVTPSGFDVSYDSQPFYVDTDGTYNIFSTQEYDGFLHIYKDDFDPGSPTVNCLAGDDDSPNPFCMFDPVCNSEIDIFLTAHRQYYAVTSSYTNVIQGENLPPEGAFTNDISGPGDPTLGIFTPGQHDLELEKTCENNYDGTGSYHLTLSNAGPTDAYAVEVQNWLSALIDDVDGNPSQGTFDNDTGLWMVSTITPGGSASLWIDFTYDINVPGTIDNHAEVVFTNGDDTDSTPGDGMGDDYAECSFIVITPEIDLSLEKTCEANDDGTGSYHLTLSNAGTEAAFSVEVQDWLSALIDDIDGDPSQGTFDNDTGLWTVGTVAAGGSASLWIDFTYDINVPATIDNHAEVVAAGGDDPDSTPGDGMGDDYDECSFIVGADLSLAKTCEADADGTGSYHLTLSNAGPTDATGVEVQDWLSALIHNVEGTPNQGTFNDDSGLWTVGDLDAGSSTSLWINFTFDLNVPGLYHNHAEVVAVNEDDPDSTPNDGGGDDYAECGFLVLADRTVPEFVNEDGGGIVDRGPRATADVYVKKSVDVETASVNTMVHYTVVVGNYGPQSTAKVQVTDHLPECLVDPTWTTTRGDYDGWVWDIGALKVDKTDTLQVWATVGPDCEGTVTNEAWKSGSTLPDPSTVSANDPQSDVEPPFTTGETRRNNRAEASFDVDTGSGRVLDGTTFALGTNYPNPFNPTTLVPFSLAESAQVSIKVYDLLGREIEVLVDGVMSAGMHEVMFEASHLPTGVYLIRMEAAGMVQIQRMTLMK